MKFNDRSMALLGIPDLPLRAFVRKADGGIIPQGGGGSSPTATTTSTSAIADFALPYVKDTLAKQSALGDRAYQPYGENRIAGFSPLQTTASTNAGNMMPNQGIGQGMDIAGQVSQKGLNTQRFGQAQADQYMSPYMQNVVDIQKREAQRASGIQGTQQQAQAAQAGAFGGSRDAIMRAERERNLGTQMGDIQATGLQNAFTNAQSQFNADEARNMQGAGLANQAASLFGSLGGQQFQQGVDINKLQSAYGAQEQAQNQKGLDLAYSDFQRQRDYPQEQLANIAAMMRGLPIPSTRTQVETGTSGSPSNLQMLTAAGMGLSRFFADGGSVSSQDNIERIVRKLSDGQLTQAAKSAQARGDQEQLQVINMELSARASIKRGLGSMPVDMNAMLPTEESMARGGVVAFADEGEVDEDAPNNSYAYSPGDPVAYKDFMGRATGAMNTLLNREPTPARTLEERDADEEQYYKKMQAMRGPDIYAEYEKELRTDKEGLATSAKEARDMAMFSAIPAMLTGNDFATAAGNAIGAYAKSQGENLRTSRAEKRAAAKGLFDLATGRRVEEAGFRKDAQAYVAEANKALKDGDTAEATRRYRVAQLLFRAAQINKPTGRPRAPAVPKPFDVVRDAIAVYNKNPTPQNKAAMDAATQAAGITSGGGVNAQTRNETIAANAKAEMRAAAIKRLTIDMKYLKGTPAQRAQMEKEAIGKVDALYDSAGSAASSAGNPVIKLD